MKRFGLLVVLACAPNGIASPGMRRAAAQMPLRFETNAGGTLVSHDGPFGVVLDRGRIGISVADRAHRRLARVTATMPGANLASRPEGDGLMAARANYLLGSDPSQWRSGAPLYQRAVYRDLYPGIDLVFHGSSGRLEYDYMVRPGARPQRIALDFAGASGMRLEADGTLALDTAAGAIRWKRPAVYQVRDGVRRDIAGGFVLRGRRVRFAIGAYDPSRELIIDPTLLYASYFGGSADESSRAIAVDAAGNFYIAGFTFSTNLPHTGGSWQQSYKNGTAFAYFGGDAFVAKFNPTGSLAYVTYLGGSSDDVGMAIAVDSGGNAYVAGYTASSDFPVTSGALQLTYRSGGGSVAATFGDAFVAKVNPTGTALVYSTYLGGTKDDKATAIAVDGAGNAYVGGATLSTDFPTKSPYQAKMNGSGGEPAFCSSCSTGSTPLLLDGDGFVAELNAAGSALLFSTYLGGSLDDTVTSLALDFAGNIYVGGNTVSPDFPTLNAFQSNYHGGLSSQIYIVTGDGFITKFDATGKLVFSTYLGGSADDAVMGLAVDMAGAVYATGFTSSNNFPVSANAARKTFAGPAGITGNRAFVWGDAFVAKLAPAGNSLVYATYLGGSADDAGLAIAVDGGGNAYVGGFAMSQDFPLTQDALQKVWGGGRTNFSDPVGDGFLAKLSKDGSTFLYTSYYGGNQDDAISGITLDGNGNVYVVGTTTSTNLPKTVNTAQASFGGEGIQTETMGDAFVAIFSGLVQLSTSISSVLNAASLTAGAAPGSLVTVYGTNLGTDASVGATVGGQHATVVLATATQWNIVIPPALPAGVTTIQIGTSTPFNVTLSQFAPGLFSANGTGTGAAAATRFNGSAVSSSNPAQPGEVITLNATGLGTGATLPTVTLGGTQVQVLSVNAGSNGTNQVVVQVPATTASGNAGIALSIGGANSNALTVPVAGAVVTVPQIVSALNGASFQPGVTPNAWLAIKGANLAATTDTWANAIVNGQLPTTLDNVSVRVGNLQAYVYYISPTQINVVAPAIDAGPVPVTVTTGAGTSVRLDSTAQTFGPAFFLWPGGYVAATRTDYSLAVKNGTFPGATTTPAKPGDVLVLWGTGFGPTNPAAPAGVATPSDQTYAVANPITVTFTPVGGGSGTAAVVYGGALAPGYAALDQVALQVPASLASGDYSVVASVGGVQSPATALLTVQQ